MTLQEILAPITVEDVETAYDFKVQAPGDANVIELMLESRIISIGERLGPPPFAQYRFDVFKYDKMSILQFPAQRQLIPHDTLCRRAANGEPRSGRVALNCQLFIETEFQRRHIGSLIYELEDKLYRKWGAEEIQLDAVSFGRIVWRNFGFTVPISELRLIESRFEQWCKEKGIEYGEVMDIMAYPEDFLLSAAVRHITMYKEL